ncbi:MAG: copper amine oxidase N-terminal domain-containing protein [Clostridia bacterium]|nr:copper amine oxidase N-terminal domain-containing protein [Clostridia bacterium]
MKKLILTVIVTVLALSAMLCMAQAEGDISVYYNAAEVNFDVKPQIINGRTMVPIRAIFEKMGAYVAWDQATSTATCTKGDIVVKMTVNSNIMYVNDSPVTMDVSPVVIDGRTLAPARYVAEAFGATVQWSQKNNAVVICSENVYAYADYPDIPDLGKCYNAYLYHEDEKDGLKTYAYLYNDFDNEDYYSDIYDNTMAVLGAYDEVSLGEKDGIVYIQYTKPWETEPRYYVAVSYADDGSMIMIVLIPTGEVFENTVTLYAPDGRTIDVYESDVESYLAVGWYRTFAETQQTLYAPDGSVITVYKSEVAAYKNVGWYETASEAEKANKKNTTVTENNNTYNPGADGNVYRTPSGKRYHFDPNCGGKNSYKTTLAAAKRAGLTPCSKCAD